VKAVAITALSSGQGKTLFTISLLHWLKKHSGTVRSYKAGPDYIDTKFHESITGHPSINLDLFMMNEQELKSIYAYYAQGFKQAVIEGVMGFYDGIDYDTSTYNIAKTLNIPVIMVISAKGTYSTIIPVIKGVREYRKDNTIKGIILNNVSSEQHYRMVKKLIEQEIPEVKVIGWIEKDLPAISSRHLGLDLTELGAQKLDELSCQVMKNIDSEKLLKIMETTICLPAQSPYELENLNELRHLAHNKKITVVYDKAFSFLYPVNLDFLKSIFSNVTMVSALNDDEISIDTDVVYLPGGYVETPEVAPALESAKTFKKSMRAISENKNKLIYAECAGLMYLGDAIQTTYETNITGCRILPLDFEMKKNRTRLGYYRVIDLYDLNIYRGHAFNYSDAIEKSKESILQWTIFKKTSAKAQSGGWTNMKKNVLGTYLHTIFFNQPELVKNYLIPDVKH
jgi:cobyrinic acid a,c-diamide synthase